MSAPRVPHLEAGYYVLRYLAGTFGLGLFLNNIVDLSLKDTLILIAEDLGFYCYLVVVLSPEIQEATHHSITFCTG